MAIEWIRKAALQNYPDACRGLAIAHEDGRGSLKASKEEARKWYQKAADLGVIEARVWLAKNR
jgi:TPR repeat protein